MREGNIVVGDIRQTSYGSFLIAKGPGQQRPSPAENGMLRYNTDAGKFEGYFSNTWVNLDLSQVNSRAPTAADDSTSGFVVGYRWIYNGNVYICTDASEGAAQWTTVSQTPSHPGLVSGQYYGSTADNTTLTMGNISTGTMYAVPFYLSDGFSFNRVGCYVYMAPFFSTSSVRLAVYNNGANGLPGTLNSDLGTITVNSAGAKEVICNFTCGGTQWWWLTFQVSATTSMYSTTGTTGSFFLGRTSPTGSGALCQTAPTTFGAFPSTFGTATPSTTNPPFLWIRSV